MSDDAEYQAWLDEFVSTREGGGYPLTRRRYYQKHFGPDTDPRKIYDQDRRVAAELRAAGAVTDEAGGQAAGPQAPP